MMETILIWFIVFLLVCVFCQIRQARRNSADIEFHMMMASKYEKLYYQWMQEYNLLRNSKAINNDFEVNLSFECFGSKKAIRNIPNE